MALHNGVRSRYPCRLPDFAKFVGLSSHETCTFDGLQLSDEGYRGYIQVPIEIAKRDDGKLQRKEWQMFFGADGALMKGKYPVKMGDYGPYVQDYIETYSLD